MSSYVKFHRASLALLCIFHISDHPLTCVKRTLSFAWAVAAAPQVGRCSQQGQVGHLPPPSPGLLNRSELSRLSRTTSPGCLDPRCGVPGRACQLLLLAAATASRSGGAVSLCRGIGRVHCCGRGLHDPGLWPRFYFSGPALHFRQSNFRLQDYMQDWKQQKRCYARGRVGGTPEIKPVGCKHACRRAAVS